MSEHEINGCCEQEMLTTQETPMYIYLPLDTSNVENSVLLDADSFTQGVKDISYLAGQIAALANVGVPPVCAIDYFGCKLTQEIGSNTQIQVTEKNNATNIAMAKYSGEMQMKQML